MDFSGTPRLGFKRKKAHGYFRGQITITSGTDHNGTFSSTISSSVSLAVRVTLPVFATHRKRTRLSDPPGADHCDGWNRRGGTDIPCTRDRTVAVGSVLASSLSSKTGQGAGRQTSALNKSCGPRRTAIRFWLPMHRRWSMQHLYKNLSF